MARLLKSIKLCLYKMFPAQRFSGKWCLVLTRKTNFSGFENNLCKAKIKRADLPNKVSELGIFISGFGY
jgi:hypothetical protein